MDTQRRQELNVPILCQWTDELTVTTLYPAILKQRDASRLGPLGLTDLPSDIMSVKSSFWNAMLQCTHHTGHVMINTTLSDILTSMTGTETSCVITTIIISLLKSPVTTDRLHWGPRCHYVMFSIAVHSGTWGHSLLQSLWVLHYAHTNHMVMHYVRPEIVWNCFGFIVLPQWTNQQFITQT